MFFTILRVIMGENTVKSRVLEHIKFTNLSVNKYANTINEAQQTVNAWVISERKPSAEHLSKIVKHFNVSPTWILVGEGQMLRDPSDVPGKAGFGSDDREAQRK